MPLITNAEVPVEPKVSPRHLVMERLVLLDEDKDVEGTEGEIGWPLKRRRRQEVSTIVKICFKEGA